MAGERGGGAEWLRRAGRPAGAALWVAVGSLIVAYLGAFGLSAWARLPFPAEFSYGESIVLAGARRVARGEPLYPPPDQLPLIVSAYMPLYYLLVGGLQRLFGDGYAVGRAVSLASTLGSAALLSWSVGRVSGCRRGGLLAGGLFLTQNMTVTLWGPLHRVDTLALCLTLGGLALATAGRPRAAAVPLVLALLTKQSYVVAPIAIFLDLWPRRRSALAFGALAAAGLVVSIGLSQALSGGWLLWYTTLANANAFKLSYLEDQLGRLLQFNALPLLAAGALFLLPTRPSERLWRLYFIGTLLTLPGIGKVGASSNYWLELTAAISAMIGLLAVRLAAEPGPRAAWARAGLAGALLGALVVVMPGYRSVVGEALVVLPSGGAGSVRAQLELGPVVATEPGELLTDDPGLAVAAGKPILFEFVIFRLLAEDGLWDERPILEAIAERRFGLVALRAPLDAPLLETEFTAGVRDALRASYVPDGQVADHWLYRPVSSWGDGPTPDASPAADGDPRVASRGAP